MEKFEGLNVSSKFAICGLPVRVDSYKTCSFGCKYCFANGRKIMEFRKNLQVADTDSIERRLARIQNRGGQEGNFLDTLLLARITWHFGGMSDPFQPVNNELRITNKIIDIANKYGYSILFSTKSDTTHGANIRPDIHAFQLSVTNTAKSPDFEPFVPSIDSRLSFFRELKREGFKVGIRIQPFIPGVSGLDIVKMFDGADHFIVEGLKVVPQNDEQKDYVFHLLGIPEEMFTQKGLLNLLPEYRYKLYQPLIEYFESHGISYSISDNDMRYLTNNDCCCGDALVRRSTTFNTTAMIRKYGRSYGVPEIQKEVALSGCAKCKCSDLFTSNRIDGATTVEEFFKRRFKKASNPASPNYQYVHNLEIF